MKSFAILAATLAGAAYAQDLPQPQGECAQLCANNMARIARSEFSCEDNNLACFCNESNWAYGIRDCTLEACEADEAMSAQEWAAARCYGVAQTATQTPAGLPILTSAIGSMSAGNGNSLGTIITSVITTSVATASDDTDGVPVTSLASSASSVIASAASSLSEELASVTSSVASDLSDAVATGTDSTNALESITSVVGSAASTVTDEAGNAISTVANAGDDAEATGEEEGAAPQITAAPYIAGLGLAAWLLV